MVAEEARARAAREVGAPIPRPREVIAPPRRALALEQAQPPGVGALFLAMHYHGRVTGCVQPADDGMRLLDEKNKKTYALVSGDVYLKPGERVLLKGKTSKGDGGTQTFTAKKLIKDLGSCGASPSASSSAASQ